MRPRGSWATCGAPNRPSTENGVKLTPLSGSHTPPRQLGDLRQAKKGTICPLLQREPKCAPHTLRAIPQKSGQIDHFFAPQRCISRAMMATESIRGELQQQLRTLLGDRVYFAASAPAPQGWLQNPRVQQLLYDLISALSTQLQIEAVGVEAQGFKDEAERLRARARAISELRFSQWHLPEVQQDLWRLVWGGSA